MDIFTFSFDAIIRLLGGGVFLFLAVRAYRSKKGEPDYSGWFIALLPLGIACLATGIFLFLGVLTERWAHAAFYVIVLIVSLVAILSGRVDLRVESPQAGTRTAHIVVYGIVLLLWIALCYVSIRDAYKYSVLSESTVASLNVPEESGLMCAHSTGKPKCNRA